MILRVALPVPINQLFDYLPPNITEITPHAGMRVRVRFGPRLMIGLIVDVVQESDYPTDKLKAAIELLDKESLIDSDLLNLGGWAARYYQHPIGDALLNLLPLFARKEADLSLPTEEYWKVCTGASLDALPKHAIKQRGLLSLLTDTGTPCSLTSLRDSGFERTQINALIEKQLIELCSPPETNSDTRSTQPSSSFFDLSSEQNNAVEQINLSQGFKAFLLAGVTGSGKTEVYFRAIEKQLNAGKQALVLVPEIGLTPQLMARFQARFSCPILCMHSGMSDRARYQAWFAAKSGHAKILIGTRSSIFVPLKDPGILLIDEEHDSSLKQQDGFRYHARDLALVRAKQLQIPIVLGSATPSLESLSNAQAGRYQLLELTQRAGGASAPTLKLLDIRHEPLDSGLAADTLSAIRSHLSAGNQALVFINRRGFSPSLVCRSCGSPVDCLRCDAHMTLHRKPPRLHCHHCDRQTPIPKACHLCGSADFHPSGSGTERIEGRLTELFANVPVHRVDRDSTHSRTAFDRLMTEVNKGEPCILVGTQMLAKGHHFPAVTLVCIINADAGLFSADFRGMERMAQLTLQVAGRAGRENRPGTVLLQTQNADHPLLQTLLDQGYMEFAAEELTSRRLAGLPPYTHQAIIQAEAKKQGWAEAYLMRIRQYLDQLQQPELMLSGPFPNQMEKRAGFFRAQLILTTVNRQRLQQVLTELRRWIDTDTERSRVRSWIDVDPIDSY